MSGHTTATPRAATDGIAVLVGERTDPVSGRAGRNRNDALAAALALSVAAPSTVRLLHAGGMSEDTARDYLALGLPAIELVATGGADVVGVLAPLVAGSRLVLTGLRARDGHGSGVLPFALAAALGRPVLAGVIGLVADGDGWLVTQALPKGARRRFCVEGPAVLAVAPSAPLALRHAHAARVAGEVLRRAAPASAAGTSPAVTALTSTATAGEPAGGERLVPAARRLVPLEARVARSGHARMQAAVGTGQPAGGTVITEGTPAEKARAVLDYLRRHALVDF